MTSPEQRIPTPVDLIAERWVDTLVALDPTVGSYIGRSADGSGFADYSPDGHARYIQAATDTIAALDKTALDNEVPLDDVDRVTGTDLRATLALELESAAAELQLRDLNVIASPVQAIREVFDLMPTGTVADWSNISARLAAVPDAVTGYIETLRLGIERGITPARRQDRKSVV